MKQAPTPACTPHTRQLYSSENTQFLQQFRPIFCVEDSSIDLCFHAQFLQQNYRSSLKCLNITNIYNFNICALAWIPLHYYNTFINPFLDTVIYLSMRVHSTSAYGIIIRIKSPICSPEKQEKSIHLLCCKQGRSRLQINSS